VTGNRGTVPPTVPDVAVLARLATATAGRCATLGRMDAETDQRFVAGFGPPPRSLRARAGEVELHVLEWGDPNGEPLVMLHGMRAHARWFTPVGPALASRYRALAVDFRGHGLSERGEGGGPAAYASDVVALADALELSSFVLLGHSMGGSVAVRAADALGERVTTLVMVDAGFGPPPDRQRGRGDRGRGRSFGEPRERAYFDRYAEGRERFKLRPGDTVADPALLDHLAYHALEPLPDGRYTWRFDLSMTGGGPRGQTGGDGVRCPVVAIYGAESPMLARLDPRSLSERFSRAASTCVDIVPGAHHHVFLDQPDAFNALLLERLG
jgi:esterase